MLINPDCPECRGTGTINLGDDADYACPACIGVHRIVGHADGSVTIEPFKPADRRTTHAGQPVPEFVDWDDREKEGSVNRA